MTGRYGLIGAAGYIAPRHLQAIADTDGALCVAYDPSDSVGALDRHFPRARFTTHFEVFADHVAQAQADGAPLDRLVVCSPNGLHKVHSAFGLRAGMDVICEKPLVLDPSDIDALAALEAQHGRRVFSILQLRHHPAILGLKAKVEAGPKDRVYDVDLSYFTSRGPWYHASWKADPRHSGGIATNIGVHFFDMLGFVFGALRGLEVYHRDEVCAAGALEFERARVRWVLSIDRDHLPKATPAGQSTYRSITVDGEEIEFSGGFTDLHTQSYAAVLGGQGFGLEIVRPSIEIVSEIRTAPLTAARDLAHPHLGSLAA